MVGHPDSNGTDVEPPAGSRQPRAYIRRRGRMTSGQARAHQDLARYLLPPAVALSDLAGWFGRSAPIGLEIGFGMGQALLDWARVRPDWNLLGIEIYQPGVGALLLGLERQRLTNVRVFEAAAETVLGGPLCAASFDEVRIFFPDPWPKTRHHKRRLIQPAFVALIADRLRPGGRLWLATDWQPYADWMEELLAAEPLLELDVPSLQDDVEHRPGRSETRFEARGRRLGHAIRDLRYRRKADARSP